MQDCHALLQSNLWQIESIMANGDIIFYINRPKPDGRVLKIVVSLKELLNASFYSSVADRVIRCLSLRE